MNVVNTKMVRFNEDDDSVRAVAIMRLDKNRRFFLGNAEPGTAEEPLFRARWRQAAEHRDNMEPDLLETVLEMHVMTEARYSASGAVDRHNEQRQDDLEIEPGSSERRTGRRG